MKKTIIAIYGRQNEGKSETIKQACKIILETFPNAIASINPVNYSWDIFLTIKIENWKIGFVSQGDPNSEAIREGTVGKLADPDDKEFGACDIIICASRTKATTVDILEEVSKRHNFHIIWKSSLQCPGLNHDVLNRIGAEGIVELIKALMLGQL